MLALGLPMQTRKACLGLAEIVATRPRILKQSSERAFPLFSSPATCPVIDSEFGWWVAVVVVCELYRSGLLIIEF